MRNLIRLVVCLAPASKLKNRLLTATGYHIDPASHFAPNLVWRVRDVSLGAGSRLRGMNVLRSLDRLHLEESASFGSWNWASAAPEFRGESPLAGVIHIGEHSAVTSRHYIDASGGIVVKRFSTVAGQRTTLLTHGIDFVSNTQKTQPISIGEYSFVSTNCVMLAGAKLPARSVLAAGAVLPGTTDTGSEGLWAGVPAKHIKAMTGAYFTRTHGRVSKQEPGS